jgi:filamentous hemagglutinin family protein
VIAKTLAVLDREPIEDGSGQLSRKWRAGFFDFLKASYGIWREVAYVAANFSWTVQAGDQVTFTYCLIGKRLEVALSLVTTASGAVASGTVAIPGNLMAARDMTTVIVVNDNGTLVSGKARVTTSGTTIVITRLDGAAFTDLRGVEGTVLMEVQ